MFYLIILEIAWICWFLFADKSRWREIFPVSIFGGFLSGLADVISYHYPLWDFHSRMSALMPDLTDNLGLYIVVVYLFIQWLPRKKTFGRMLGYWFAWTGVAIGIEWLHLHMGRMHYGLWWNMGWSYVSDWLLFLMFYYFHKIFHLERLSEVQQK